MLENKKSFLTNKKKKRRNFQNLVENNSKIRNKKSFLGPSNANNKKVILCIAEKNSVAKEITNILCLDGDSPLKLESKSRLNPVFMFPYRFLEDECNMVVTSVCGHIKQLEFDSKFSNWDSMDPKILLDLSTPVLNSIMPECKDISENLSHFSKISTYLILWLDCDREGENIAFEVISICLVANPNLIVFRAHFSAITKIDIENAMNNLSFPNRALSDAVEARREIDLRVGSSFTRFLTLRYKKIFPIPEQTLSYGTCQFPTLGFVVRRFNQIINFSEEKEWSIILNVYVDDQKSSKLTSVKFQWERGKLFDRLLTFIIYETCIENLHALVTDIDHNRIIKLKPLPLNTTEMTKMASKKLGISPSKCMKIAEGLYQKGYISYPRTETNIFLDSIDLLQCIKKQIISPIFGEYAHALIHLNKFSVPRRGIKDDNSHPPIHPVKYLDKEKASSNEEWSLYELITRHFLAVCSKDAILLESTIKICISEEYFKSKGVVSH